MDSILYDQYNNLYELLQYEFIKIILKNDSHIYGDILRYIVIQNKTFYEFCDIQKSFSIWTNIKLLEVLERDLNKFILYSENISQDKINKILDKYFNKPIVQNVLPISSNIKSSDSNLIQIKCYHCKIFNKNILLHILYIDYDSPQIVYYALKNLLDITFDINLLSLNRTGLNMIYIPDYMKHDPVPIYTIINNVKNKELNILKDNMVYGKSTFDILLQYIQKSWIIQNTKVKFITRSNPIFLDSENICNICVNDLHDKPDDNEGYNLKDRIIILPCKHIFHYKCWLHKIKSNLLLNIKSIRCPHYSCNYQLDIADAFL